MDKVVVGLLWLVGLGACVDSPNDSAVAVDEIPDDAVFYETVITHGPDGPIASEPVPITAGTIRAQNEMKAAVARGELHPTAIAHVSCGITAFWLYDREHLMGNRICFEGAGLVYLVDYLRVLGMGQWGPIWGNWVLREGSFYAGLEPGVLRDANGSFLFTHQFGPYEHRDRINASDCCYMEVLSLYAPLR